MRTNVFAGMMLLVAAMGVATLNAVPARQTAAVRFLRPTIVAGVFVQGTVVFEHDDVRMAKGEPCTRVYYYDNKTNGPGDMIVEFMCVPNARPAAAQFEATLVRGVSWPDTLLEYQFAGEHESHGVPVSK